MGFFSKENQQYTKIKIPKNIRPENLVPTGQVEPSTDPKELKKRQEILERMRKKK